MTPPLDTLGRPLRDLRVSVTDRCNMRCPYCMPAEVFGPGYIFTARENILSFEEITRVVQITAGLGVRKVRLTGGEPLLRRDLAVLVGMLSRCRGIEDLALTTNGLALATLAQPLRAAGLHRVTVSLDALDNAIFRRMSGSGRSVDEVTDGLAAARHAALPVKINCVLQRGVNDSEILPLARFCRDEGYTLRFIEYMDVGNHQAWNRSAVVPSSEVRAKLESHFALEPLPSAQPGEVARRFRYADGRGEVGFVSSVTEPFCRGCNRGRLTADGRLITCLFAEGGADTKSLLRGGATDAELESFVRAVWENRTDRYSELRAESPANTTPKVEMSYVGG